MSQAAGVEELPKRKVNHWETQWSDRQKTLRCDFIGSNVVLGTVDVSCEGIDAQITWDGTGELVAMEVTPSNDDGYVSISEAQRAIALLSNILAFVD